MGKFLCRSFLIVVNTQGTIAMGQGEGTASRDQCVFKCCLFIQIKSKDIYFQEDSYCMLSNLVLTLTSPFGLLMLFSFSSAVKNCTTIIKKLCIFPTIRKMANLFYMLRAVWCTSSHAATFCHRIPLPWSYFNTTFLFRLPAVLISEGKFSLHDQSKHSTLVAYTIGVTIRDVDMKYMDTLPCLPDKSDWSGLQ